MTQPAREPIGSHTFTTHLRPLIVTRMSAIGDTVMTARAQHRLTQKGYAPILLTHKNNAALLGCMPLLQGACLWSDGHMEFFLRKTANEALTSIEKNEFFEWLGSHAQFSNDKKCVILDLQRTGRSKRAIRDLCMALSENGLANSVRNVRKGTFWRVLLILWAHLALRQWLGRTPPNWLKRRLISVHEHQAHLIQSLPKAPALVESSPTEHSPLSAPQFKSEGLSDYYVLFAVGASARLKAWPREHYRSLLKLILADTNAQICLCGGSAESALGDYLTFGHDSRVVNLIGKTSLAETLGLIQGAAYVVTGDSFASHVCDLMKVPASVIFGSTHPQLGFAPQGNHTIIHHSELSCSPCSRHGQGDCRFKNVRCLTSVKPEEVFSQLRLALRE